LFGAPYDWRHILPYFARDHPGGPGFYRNLTQLIEKAVEKTGQPAVLITHSYGGPILHDFLTNYGASLGVNQAWKHKHLKSWIALAPAWSGTPKTWQTLIDGSPIPFLDETGKMSKTVTMTVPAVGYLSASESVADYYGDQVFVKVGTKEYGAKNFQEFLADAKLTQMLAMQKDMVKNHWTLSRKDSGGDPWVTTHVLYGTGVDTDSYWEFDQLEPIEADPDPDCIMSGRLDCFGGLPHAKNKGTMDGDGTLPSAALVAKCKTWPSSRGRIHEFKNIKHQDFLNNPEVLAEVFRILGADAATVVA